MLQVRTDLPWKRHFWGAQGEDRRREGCWSGLRAAECVIRSGGGGGEVEGSLGSGLGVEGRLLSARSN